MTKSDLPIDDAMLRALGLSPSNDKTHYEALGRFIASFAHAEGIVHEITRKLSGLSDEKARITFGGMRLSDVIDRLRQYINLESTPKDTFSEIDSCITQLSNIADRRHKLVHRGAVYSGGLLVSSNVMTTRSLKNIELETIDETLLYNMTLDCGAIFLRLLDIVAPERSDQKQLAIMRGLTWRYKHEPPKSQNQQRRKAPGS